MMNSCHQLDAALKAISMNLSAVPGGLPHLGTTKHTNNIVYSCFGQKGFEGEVVGIHDSRTDTITVYKSFPKDLVAGIQKLPGYLVQSYPLF